LDNNRLAKEWEFGWHAWFYLLVLVLLIKNLGQSDIIIFELVQGSKSLLNPCKFFFRSFSCVMWPEFVVRIGMRVRVKLNFQKILMVLLL
jgi:hypothetical protein